MRQEGVESVKTIWRFPMTTGENKLSLPRDAKFLSIGIAVDKSVSAYFLVAPGVGPEARLFWLFGTGWEVPEGLDYLGTVTQHQGYFVWHLFEAVRGHK